MSNDWNKEELTAIVDDYFSMLMLEQTGKAYNKSQHNRKLRPGLNNRSKAAVEFKHRNISSILVEQGHPFIKGYLPAQNKQGLLEKVVLERLQSRYPQSQHSWTLLSPTVIIKQMDKSSFRYNGSGIPKQFTGFFGASATDGQRQITLIHNGQEFSALLQPDPPEQRVRLFWKNGLEEVIIKQFPDEYEAFQAGSVVPHPPELRFSRTDRTDIFKVELLAPEQMFEAPPVIPEEAQPLAEGAKEHRKVTTSKRSAANRRKAIQYHGLDCAVCGFNFEKRYGELGRGFIEVHHITELGKLTEELLVDPHNEMIPLCSNCHRMIHKVDGLMIEDLEDIVNRHNAKPENGDRQ